ncbi:DUF1028 domain-containing protein [Herbaspirillum sp. YR522]|uniref:DUF1028 domain-containing protein n=1 Tax=Herbaspirillum sp. YR522 TaxID=1144342 RepID=UPI00026FBC60|nr:DUF1028 domain-containing protein [Herbaspirillum sp. YR522]EJN02708.1 hypothetical protein PMI40_03068 [Herbaspirillum sp. YR522]
MTFSIIARCARTGMLGMAVTSSSLCVASRCAWTRAGAGVVATQNLTDPGLGVLGLDLLEHGLPAAAVLDMLVRADPQSAYRQLLVLDTQGRTAHFTGARALPTHAYALGVDCAAAGNMLADSGVPQAMIAGFAASADLPLAERLLRALEQGLAAGGEERELRSAGVQVAHALKWPVVDLRVDGQDRPLQALRALWQLYEPLQDGYVSRASAPQDYVLAPAAPASTTEASR